MIGASAAASALLAGAVHAQTPASPRDSSVRDTAAAPCDTTPILRHTHGMQAALYALVLAPPLLMNLPDSYERPACAPPLPPPPVPPRARWLGWWGDHVALAVEPGYAASSRNPPLDGWESASGAASAEVLRGRYLVQGRVERFRTPEPLEYRTVRVGRLWRPDSSVAGGVTLGYRDVDGPRPRQRGVEVGFPFVVGRERWWFRLESAYVISLHQSSYSWRMQYDRRLGGGPFFGGARVAFDSWEIRDHGELSHTLFAFVLGTTFRSW